MKLEEVKKYRKKLIRAAIKRHASNIRVFGSVARGDATKSSDVDILVTLDKKASLFDLSALGNDIQKILGCRVDVVPDNSINARFRQIVLSEAVPI